MLDVGARADAGQPFLPSMFMAHEPHMPSRHERRKLKVESISFLILIRASSTIGPQSSISTS